MYPMLAFYHSVIPIRIVDPIYDLNIDNLFPPGTDRQLVLNLLQHLT